MASSETVLEVQLAAAHNVLRLIFRELLGPMPSAELDLVLRGNLLDVFHDLSHESLTEFERTLLAHGIEELVAIRSMLTVEADARAEADGRGGHIAD